MTLAQIISAALEQLGYTPDAQTEKVWHNKFTQLANEGMIDLGEAINLRRTDTATVTDGEINIDALPYECRKILRVQQAGSDVTPSRGTASNKIKVNATGTVTVEYRYVPNAMSSDTDIPELPASLHALIVTYVCARHHMTANVDTQGRYNAMYNEYMQRKSKAVSHYGEPENYALTNVPGWS